jgi:hypothetical protein
VHTEQFEAIGWGKVVFVNVRASKVKPTNEQTTNVSSPIIGWEKENSFDTLVMAVGELKVERLTPKPNAQCLTL